MHVTARRRAPWPLLAAMIRNPLDAIPPEVFHASLVTSDLVGRRRIYVTDPALIREAFVTHAGALGKTADLRRAFSPAVGSGLLTADGAHWRWQRGAAAAAFRPDRLQAFLPGMLGAAEAMVARWGVGAELDIGHEMTRTAFDVISGAMLSGSGGLEVDQVEHGMKIYLRSASWALALSLLRAPEWTPFPGRRRAMAAARRVRASLTASVAQRRAGPGTQDMLDLLLGAADPETGRTLTDAEIADNLLTLIAAGHETTASALTWCLYLLARHPAHADAIRAEIDAVTGGGPLRPEHVADLVHARAAVLETLRLYPSAPVIARTVLQGFRLGPLDVPAGAFLYVPIHAVHRQAAHWPDPERFDPSRFTPAAEKARDRYSFLPFGAGPRVCIGAAFATMEAVAILAVVLRAGRLDALGDAPRATTHITMRPARPLRMRWAADRVPSLCGQV